VLRGVSDASSYCDCLCQGDVTLQVKLFGFPTLVAHCEVRFFEVLRFHSELRVFRDFAVGQLYGLGKFLKRLGRGRQISN
jgi:hypothetical protein